MVESGIKMHSLHLVSKADLLFNDVRQATTFFCRAFYCYRNATTHGTQEARYKTGVLSEEMQSHAPVQSRLVNTTP